MSDKPTYLGHGRANLSGGSATVTMPKEVADMMDIGGGGIDVIWFEEDGRLIAAHPDEVSIGDTDD